MGDAKGEDAELGDRNGDVGMDRMGGWGHRMGGGGIWAGWLGGGQRWGRGDWWEIQRGDRGCEWGERRGRVGVWGGDTDGDRWGL